MSIRTVGVVGTGVIGSSWIGLFLARGLQVIVSDPASGAEQKLAAYLQAIWPTMQKSGLAPNAALTNYRFVGAQFKHHFANVDFVQENAPERIELKTDILGEIDAATRPDVVIASSSSGIPSSRFISKCAVNAGRVLIGHPFNPPHLMPLVEVVPHAETAAASTETAMNFYKSLGRKPVLIRQEIPGFAANRLQAAVCNEAYSLVSRGVLSAQDLDTCVTSSLGPRWAVTGPLLSNAMGGGGGTDGFKHFLEHLGPATRSWMDDMQAHAFQWTPEGLATLRESVAKELQGKDTKELERKRDQCLVEVLRVKGDM
ncbi:L-carnitine dehydrogenase [Metarhizium brunneum]|uniref:L-gulonate 3-dehydrogenase n=1 Tax=Metarhizium brunneum TaxID=500148 RepID=A0A7D5UVV7_9HYPO|nr:L-carnitine dehydrogenase [Metarhizium brunneum]